ncbi:MAG: alpha-D-ribose 1-methylphosphonate 5-triphosphate diphosphatase [Proteobacteria bacterium]|nr:alpha-D-ribose 1-methylphosphonate 5-triphosphate diphosphatase [Pseudomonadota bacterium]
MAMRIQGGQALINGTFVETDVVVDDKDGAIAAVGANGGNGRAYDARGLYVLPGIVDIHADAFERQLMPRPGVGFPIDLALQESDRQAVGNGITTLFHGVTWSWEPGLRGADNARAALNAIEDLNPSLGADTRCHLRHETYNLDAEAEITDWLGERRIAMLGFNDHMPSASAPPRTRKIAEMAARAGLTVEDFNALVERLRARANEVPGSIERLARAAGGNAVATLSHDDNSPAQRQWFRALGCRVAEFPVNLETADDATRAGDNVVMGAPNVVRGGSHIGWIAAADMIGRGLCTVLASDYYYPAPLLAPFRLAADKVAPLEQAWRFVSERPAQAAGLEDRGILAPGMRADIVVVDASDPLRPKAVATMAEGRFVHVTDSSRFN